MSQHRSNDFGTKRATRESAKLIAVSITESEDLLPLGYEHEYLKNVLLRLCRPLLRRGADLAYGGHLKIGKSFTRDLIELISSEQEAGDADSMPWIGRLFNHIGWPYYDTLTKEDEALWVDCVTFIRITQETAGLKDNAVIQTPKAGVLSKRIVYNISVVMTEMRRSMNTGMSLANSKDIPPIFARIILGGKVNGYTGVMPGIYEEAYFALDPDNGVPLYIIGGFGGAAGRIADFLLEKNGNKIPPPEFTQDYHRKHTKTYSLMEEAYAEFGDKLAPKRILEEFCNRLNHGRKQLDKTLANGLNKQDNKTLLRTQDISEVVKLILKGLIAVVNKQKEELAHQSTTKKKAAKKRSKK